MTNYSELKRLADDATPGPWVHGGNWVSTARGSSVADCARGDEKFIAAANPAAVLALIADNASLKGKVETFAAAGMAIRDAWREDQAEIRQLKAEVEALRKAMRKIMNHIDGNIRETVRDCVNGRDDVQDIYEYCDDIEALIDAALSKESGQ